MRSISNNTNTFLCSGASSPRIDSRRSKRSLDSAAVRAGVWLRPFRDLIYTMPPYVAGDDDVAAICAGVLAAVEAAAGAR